MESPDDLSGKVLGRYTIVSPLGRGGMGVVYRAVQAPLGREVALKVIKSDIRRGADVVARFHREALAVSQLAHPNIVTLFDFGEDDGNLYFAMELQRGESLRERLRSRGRFPVLACLAIVRDIAAGLAAAHERGILHRDLKPDNVMLVHTAGRRDLAKLLDFGVARVAEEDAQPAHATPSSGPITQVGTIVGTPGYLAPEAVVGGAAHGAFDPRSDLYALGVVWWEMLTGRALFEAPTPMALVLRHVSERAPRLDSIDAGIPRAVVDLVDALLERDPALRPASAADLLVRIDELLHPATPSQPWSDPSMPTMDATTPPELGLAAADFLRAPTPHTTTPHTSHTKQATQTTQTTPHTTTLTTAPLVASPRPLLWAALGATIAIITALLTALVLRGPPAPPPREAGGVDARTNGDARDLDTPRARVDASDARAEPAIVDAGALGAGAAALDAGAAHVVDTGAAVAPAPLAPKKRGPRILTETPVPPRILR